MWKLFDRQESPIPQLPWIIANAFRAAPVELLLNLTANLTMGAISGLILVMTRQVVDSLQGDSFGPNLAMLAGLLLLNQVAGAVNPVTTQILLDKTARYTRLKVMEKATALSLLEFDRGETHDLIHRATNIPGPAMSQSVVLVYAMAGNAIRIGSALAFLGSLAPWMTAVACLAALPIGWAGIRHGRRAYGLFRKQSRAARMADYLTRLLTDRPAATELRAYGLVTFFLERWQRIFGLQTGELVERERQGAGEGLLADLATTALFLMTLAYFTGPAISARLTIGTVVAVTSSIRLLRGGTTGIAFQAGGFWNMALPLLDLRRFLELPGEERPLSAGRRFPTPLRGVIRFEQVSFRYPGRAELVLQDLSLEIRAGERIALVGLNGAGKSTLIKLLLGLYLPTAGRITYDGIDIADIAPESLREHVSCIFQDFARYELSAAENIELGRPGATRDEVVAAARQAGAAELIEALPAGYDTLLGKRFEGGQELSGGQWQRIALARAFVRNADLIVLDEPTAALDPLAELDLFGKFVDLVAGRTAVLISHRLGIARLADRILVLSDGRIVEEGTHAQLISAGGQYATLFQAQAQWYEAEVAS